VMASEQYFGRLVAHRRLVQAFLGRMQRPIHLGHLTGMFAPRLGLSDLAPFVKRIRMDTTNPASILVS
jgi:hypothetical protein